MRVDEYRCKRSRIYTTLNVENGCSYCAWRSRPLKLMCLACEHAGFLCRHAIHRPLILSVRSGWDIQGIVSSDQLLLLAVDFPRSRVVHSSKRLKVILSYTHKDSIPNMVAGCACSHRFYGISPRSVRVSQAEGVLLSIYLRK